MNIKIPNKILIAVGIMLAFSSSLFSQEEDENIYELGQFTVAEDETEGYRASNTLAGSRLKTPLRDVGQSISVLTEEFFNDTGATDAETALSYVMSMEVSGEQGNFSAASINGGGANSTDTADNLRSPQNAQRVRGLARAELTRSYFLTDIPFDTYNTGRVTISRGPNSLLFGIGSPGGVIENSLNIATLGEDFGEIAVRVGERGGHRLSVDYNKVIVADRLAIRVSALNETANFKQEPAFEKDSRFFAAIQAVLFKNENSDVLDRTILRANFENGEMRANPVNILPPGDAIKDWFYVPNPAIQDIVGVNWANADGNSVSWAVNGAFQPKWIVDNNRPQGFPRAWRTVDGSARPPYFQDVNIYFQQDGTAGIGFPSAPGVQGVQGRIQYKNGEQGHTIGNNPRGELFLVKPFEGETYSTGFTIPSVMDRNIWDNHNNLFSGNLNFRDQDFNTSNFTLEQSFFDGNAGVELAFDQQDYERRTATLLTSGRFNALTIDPNGYLNYPGLNPDSSSGPADYANPNAGRPVAPLTGQSGGDRGDEQHYLTDREAFRATAYYNLDFTENDGATKWFGRHILSAFYNDQDIESVVRDIEGYYVGAPVDQLRNCVQPCNDAFAWQYLGPSMLGSNITKPGDIHVDRGVFLPSFGGNSYEVAYWDDANNIWETGSVTETQALNNGSRRLDSFQSEVYSVQSYLLEDHLVGLVGWRTDSIQNYSVAANSFPRDSAGNRPEPAGLDMNRLAPLEDVDSFTWSLVGHLPWEIGGTKLSGHYSESENFQPTGLRRNAYGNVIGSPQGTTKEYGVSFELFEGKLFVRTNWFETVSSLQQADDGGGIGGAIGVITTSLNEWQAVADGDVKNASDMPYTIAEALSPLSAGGLQDSQKDLSGQWTSYEQLLQTILGTIPSSVQENAKVGFDPSSGNWEVKGDFGGRVATQNVAADGFEMEVVANPTKNWRIGFNLTQQETVTSDTAVILGEVIDQVSANIKSANLSELRDRPQSTTGFVFDSTYFRSSVLPLANARAKDNTAVQELVEWRWNLFTNYQFSQDTFLNGFGVGGALRWQDKVATGYELKNVNGSLISDVSKAFFGKDDLAGDVWVTYRGKLSDKLDYRLQFNARNLIGEDDYILIASNPDGSNAIVRNPNPTEVFLSATLMF
jgi:outer membrane receptor protein involved in Fe transport